MKKFHIMLKKITVLSLAGALALSPVVYGMSKPVYAAETNKSEDRTMYRGTLLDIRQEEDAWYLELRQETGTNFGFRTITCKADDSTKYSGKLADLKEGDYIQVYYKTGSDQKKPLNTKLAVQIKKLLSADLSVFNGTVEKKTGNDKSGTILLKDLSSELTILFRYHDKTQIYTDISKVKKGDRLNIYYNGMLTRSIPAQGTASEIRSYQATDTYKGTITKITKKGDDFVLSLTKAEGTPYKKKLTILLNSKTKSDMKLNQYKKGDYIEVFYSVPSKKTTAAAVTVQKLLDSQICVSNATLVEVKKDDNKENHGTLMVKDQNNQEIWFHYSYATEFKTPVDQLKKGMKLSIYHRGAITLSIPPQGGAIMVSQYQA